MEQALLFPELLPEAPEPDPEDASPPQPRPRPRARWQRPPELFPEHAAAMRRKAEAALRAARIAADRSAKGSPGRRPMVRNPISAVICVVRREVWGSRPKLARAAKVPVDWIARLEQEVWSGRVIDELAFERRRSELIRRMLGLSIVELLDIEEDRLDLSVALETCLDRARKIKASGKL